MAQDGAECWAIIDGSMRPDVVVSDPYYYQRGVSARDPEKVAELLETSPSIVRGGTVEDLARQMGMPSEALADTLNRYNGYIDDGLERDPEFHRRLPSSWKASTKSWSPTA